MTWKWLWNQDDLPVAKGEISHPTWPQTQVSRAEMSHFDCDTQQPGSLIWQTEYILNRSDSILSHCPPLQEVHLCISPLSYTYLFPSQCFTHHTPRGGSSYRDSRHTPGTLMQSLFWRHTWKSKATPSGTQKKNIDRGVTEFHTVLEYTWPVAYTGSSLSFFYMPFK